MPNEQNLIPQAHKLTVEEASRGGKASGETRRRRKAFAEAFEVLLEKQFTDRSGKQLQGVDAVAAKVFQQAMDGDMRAVQFLRDTVGEAPVQKLEVAAISPESRAEMDRLLGMNE